MWQLFVDRDLLLNGMTDMVRIVNKKVGQTPLECIDEIKKNEPKLVHLPLTYAGRLDPLAKGLLLILVGDECHKKDEYLALSKEYEVTILFGFETDTYDVMGKIIGQKDTEELNNYEMLENILPQFTGRIRQAYPPYSSRTVLGKPLFKWAREGKINEITIPSHDVFVEKIEMIKQEKINGDKLLNKIKGDISKVKGDFRQTDIINIWKDVLNEKKEQEFNTVTLRISCGSGVYVRGLAHDLGHALKIPALALEIIRTKVGEYEIN